MPRWKPTSSRAAPVADTLMPVLRGLHAELDGAVTLIWDNLPAHISAAMRAFVAAQRDWLEVVRLPSYASDLNPVEGVWSTLKGRDLAGHACRNVDELLLAAQVGVIRIRREPDLLWGFLRHTGLPLDDFTELPKDRYSLDLSATRREPASNRLPTALREEVRP